MIGAIIGDIVGSRFEFNNHRSTDFDLFGPGCNYTDDTVMTVAVADAIIHNASFKEKMLEYGSRFSLPMGGYGGSFGRWLHSINPQPYDSFGNGSAMRVSPCALLSKGNREWALAKAACSAMPTHNHPEGIKGALATTDAILMAFEQNGEPKKFFTSSIEMRNILEQIREVPDGFPFETTIRAETFGKGKTKYVFS